MKQRCYNPKNQHYKWYGAKGITLCEEWMGEDGVSRFMEWALNNGYEEHLSIDRLDSAGDSVYLLYEALHPRSLIGRGQGLRGVFFTGKRHRRFLFCFSRSKV